MIRYISYVGPKDSKRIKIANGREVNFPKGKAVNILEAGIGERKAHELLKTGLFKLHGAMEPVPLEEPEPENVCQCGFKAKTLAGLKAHQRFCQ